MSKIQEKINELEQLITLTEKLTSHSFARFIESFQHDTEAFVKRGQNLIAHKTLTLSTFADLMESFDSSQHNNNLSKRNFINYLQDVEKFKAQLEVLKELEQ